MARRIPRDEVLLLFERRAGDRAPRAMAPLDEKHAIVVRRGDRRVTRRRPRLAVLPRPTHRGHMASLLSLPGIPPTDQESNVMGRPRHVKPARVGANRRDFFRRSGSAAVALATAPMLTLGSAQAAARACAHHRSPCHW